MARLDPSSYKPISQFHFQVKFSQLDAPDFVTYAKATALPSLTQTPIKIDYGNTYMYVKGKTVWNEIAMTFYGLSDPDTNTKFWKYLQKHQKTESGIDQFKMDYMNDIQLMLLNPDETEVGTWRLINAFVSTMNFGQVDWSSEDILQHEISFIYDYATWTPKG